ncbi:MAG: hypothetical protein FWE90_02340 [Defluviitaleaceae bacterium]|nr:hypothetical protein [Defluviitaleaceae bacterium]
MGIGRNEAVETEVKLHVNRRLYQKGVITEEMYVKAKEIILKGKAGITYGYLQNAKRVERGQVDL